jgi:hypothetical protein
MDVVAHGTLPVEHNQLTEEASDPLRRSATHAAMPGLRDSLAPSCLDGHTAGRGPARAGCLSAAS